MKDVKQLLSNRIKRRLKELNLKQKDLIEKTGHPKSTVSKIVNGAVTPRIDVLIPISKVLDVSIDWLVCEKEDIKTDGYSLDNIEKEIITLLRSLDEQKKTNVYFIIKYIVSLIQHNETASLKKKK
ncbi:transcriptional regulator with XRE-family HTH domain [Anoxybacillus tepidamans]|uniref:Transcriptional regulator with XRE-family HTH domain n=1 Tax=Anoxybacteroides tepidamans TaxID=265948 RepID=A0A7W8MXZ0_9BACL|nr:helix-turn-helix transcriptional regulator [Anoxybacillus tepidamans]MBB5326130.1 transcriptional regulator with XRE-family HTH domain [Anoxybacillus tepidamans]